MSKFKVGDRVRRVAADNAGGEPGSEWVLPVGATATVEYVMGFEWPDGFRNLRLKEVVGAVGQVPEYSEHWEKYFELVQEPAKQAAKAGGLQEHSLGDCYPYAVVGYGNGGTTTFVVENLQTGEVAVDNQGGLCSGDAYKACRMQANIAKGEWHGGWSKDRPRFLFGDLSIPDEASSTYAAELASQENKLGRKLTPREQYQLAMEIGK